MRRVLVICGFVLVFLPVLFGFTTGDRDTTPIAFGPTPASVAHPLRDELGREPILVMPAPPKPKLFPFDWPAKGSITGVYGNDDGRPHPGIDIGILRSLRVQAAAPGRVIVAGQAAGYEGYGNLVVVRTGKMHVLYAHLSRVAVKKGEIVKRDERLGTAGCTGYCTGTHLHFEVRNKEGRTLNPMRMLASANAS